MLIIPPVGTTAKFTFSAPFTDLNGIYTLTQALSFEAAVADEISLFDHFYALAGQDRELFDAEWADYKADTILKLVSVADASVVVYAPSLTLAKVPDPQILKCQQLYLAVDLGTFQDVEEVSYMLDQIDDIAAGVSGTQKKTQLYSSGTVWLTASDYQIIVDARADRITGLDLQSKIITAQAATIIRLQTLVAQYEATLISLQSE